MHAFTQHFTFEFRTGIRNKNLLLMNYLFPLGFYLLMGFIMPEINPFFRDALIPAMLTFAILVATLLGLPDPLVQAREAGIFRSYKINGVPALSILAIPALTTVLHLAVVSAIIAATAPWLFDAAVPQSWGNLLLVWLALTLACTGLGVLIGVISPSTRLTVLLAQAIFLPSMLLGGLMMPLEMLPETAVTVARFFPATQAMNAFNGLAMGFQPTFAPWSSMMVLAAAGIVAFVLSLLLFRWDSHTPRRRGQMLLVLLVLLPFALGLLF